MQLFYPLLIIHIVTNIIAFRVDLSVCRDNFALFSKNPHLDRKVRTQRRARRLKQIIPPLVARLEHMERSTINNFSREQRHYFGYRLSQIPGDGGVIYGKRDLSTIINYYQGYFYEKAKKKDSM